MQCPYCDGDSQVVDSRTTTEAVRRRRICNGCKRRFTTYERVAAPGLKVVKRSGKTELFDSSKLQHSLARVCRGRPGIGAEDLRRIARDIEARLVDSSAKTIRSSDIVDLALRRLGEIDMVAQSRLAANYLDDAGQLRTDNRGQNDGDHATQLGLFEPEEPEE